LTAPQYRGTAGQLRWLRAGPGRKRILGLVHFEKSLHTLSVLCRIIIRWHKVCQYRQVPRITIYSGRLRCRETGVRGRNELPRESREGLPLVFGSISNQSLIKLSLR
jgi:hypothetical protein